MLRSTAVTLLRGMTAPAARPVVDTSVLDALLDGYGTTVGSDPTTATWDGSLDQVAAEVWSWKAAQVAGDFNFSADDARYDKGAVMANCLAMRDLYLAKLGGSYGGPSLADACGVVVNDDGYAGIAYPL